MSTTMTDLADEVISTLRAHESKLRAAGLALERHVSELLGRPVDLIPEPVEKQRLQANIDRDRRRAF